MALIASMISRASRFVISDNANTNIATAKIRIAAAMVLTVSQTTLAADNGRRGLDAGMRRLLRTWPSTLASVAMALSGTTGTGTTTFGR